MGSHQDVLAHQCTPLLLGFTTLQLNYYYYCSIIVIISNGMYPCNMCNVLGGYEEYLTVASCSDCFTLLFVY